MANPLLGYSGLLGTPQPINWKQLGQALWETNLNAPIRGFYNLMNTPDYVLMGGPSPEFDKAVADSFDAAGGITVGSMPMPKPANSLTMGWNKEGRNGRELPGHQFDAQPVQLQPTVRQELGNTNTSRLSSEVLEDVFKKAGIAFRKEHSTNYSEKFGPSASTYYYLNLPDGVEKIRLSNHDYPSGAKVDLRYDDNPDLSIVNMMRRLGLPPPADAMARAYPLLEQRALQHAENQLKDFKEHVDWVNNTKKKAVRQSFYEGYFERNPEAREIISSDPQNPKIIKILDPLDPRFAYGIAGASAMLGYNLMNGLDKAQATTLNKADLDHQYDNFIRSGGI